MLKKLNQVDKDVIDFSENGFVRPDLINAYMKTKTPIQCHSISDEPKKKTKSSVSMKKFLF